MELKTPALGQHTGSFRSNPADQRIEFIFGTAAHSEANLARIPHMAETFDCRAGLSDHTLGIAVPVAAAALGAQVIEKHFCRSRSEPGPDSAFSLEPDEFRDMVEAVHTAAKAVGRVTYERTPKEQASLAFRRSLFFARDLPAGHQITVEDVRVVRPGHGIAPEYLDAVIGKILLDSVQKGRPVKRSDVNFQIHASSSNFDL